MNVVELTPIPDPEGNNTFLFCLITDLSFANENEMKIKTKKMLSKKNFSWEKS